MPPLPYKVHIDKHKTSAVRKLQKPLKALDTDDSFVTFDTNPKRTKEQDTMIRVVKKLGLVDAKPVNSQGPIRKTKKSDGTHAIPQDAPLATTRPRAKAASVGHSTLRSPGGGGAYRDHPPTHPPHSAPRAPSLEHPPAFKPPALSVGDVAEPLLDVYAARHPRATVTPGAPTPVHPFDYPALPYYEPILPLPYQFSTLTQMVTSSAPFEVEQSLARHRHRDRAAARSRNDPYLRFGAPIQDQDGQYFSYRALPLDDNFRHEHVVGDPLQSASRNVKLRDNDLRAHWHYNQSIPSVAVHGSVDRQLDSRHSLTEDTTQAASATSSFGVSEDEARFAPTYGVSPSVQRAPVGVEYTSSYNPSYNMIAHSDTMLNCAGLTSMESPIAPVDAAYGFQVDVASTDPIVSDTSHATRYYGTNSHNANWYHMQQEGQVSDYQPNGSIFASQQTISDPSSGYSKGLFPRQVVSLSGEQRHEHTFATADSLPYNPYGPYGQLPHNAIPVQTPVTAHHHSQRAAQDYALLADPASHIARAAYSQGFTIGPSPTSGHDGSAITPPYSLGRGHHVDQATTLHFERTYHDEPGTASSPVLQRGPFPDGPLPYSFFSRLDAEWLPFDVSLPQAAAGDFWPCEASPVTNAPLSFRTSHPYLSHTFNPSSTL